MEHSKYIIKKYNFTQTGRVCFSAKNYYKIILISKGACYFDLDEATVFCNTETAVFLKPNAQITMEHKTDKKPLEILSFRISPDVLEELSDNTCNLEKGFSFIPIEKSLIHLDARNITLIKNILHTILALNEQTDEFGHELYEKNMLSILLILFLRSCIASDHVKLSHRQKQFVMDDVFRYIRDHITEDLSLRALEEHFFISKHHLCREFKKQTGQTIHSYILKSRLDLCKKHIEMGKPIKEVYEIGGFGSYNHFFRAFKKEYGMTPKEYYESLI